MKQSIKVLVGAFAVVGFASTVTTLSSSAIAQGSHKVGFNFTQEKSPMAKVTPVEAMKAAEGKTGGKATTAIFEFDEGHWVYGVIVVKNHKLTEVDVDPITGKAGATEAVTPDDEAKEFKDALLKMTK